MLRKKIYPNEYKQMSAPKTPAAVAVPTSGSTTDAVAATPIKGGAMLSPLPLSGGRRRKTRRLSKKAVKMLKKMTPKQIKKMLKGGQEPAAVEEGEMEGARRRRSRKGSRKSRRGMFY